MRVCTFIVVLAAAVTAGCELYRDFRNTPPICRSKAIPPVPGTDPAAVRAGEVRAPASQPAANVTLEECVRLALSRNGGIRIADRRVLIAQDRVREAWSIDLPKLTAQGRFDIQEKKRVPAYMVPAQTATGGRTRIPFIDRDVASVSTTLLVPIYNFGAGYHQREAARIGVDVAGLTAERARQDLVMNVKQAYFRVLEAQKIRGVVLESIQTVTRQLEIARDFFGQGLVAKSDVLVVEVQLAERQLQLNQAENNIQLAMATLNRLIGEPVTRELRLQDVFEVPPWKGNFDVVFFTAIQLRPDLEALRRQIAIVEQQYRATRANLAPQFSGFITYNYTDTKNVQDRDSAVGGFVADWSVFDGGLTLAQMARLSKEINEAIDAQSETEKDIILDVKQAYLNLNYAAAQIPVAKKSIELAEENLRITRDQYSQGLLTSEDVLLQEERLAQARSNYYQALYGYHQAFAVLANTIGATPPSGDVGTGNRKPAATRPAGGPTTQRTQ